MTYINEHIDIIRKLSPDSLNRAMEIAHVGCWEWNIQDGSAIWSDEQFRIFGYDPGEVNPSYQLFIESVHPDDRDRVIKAVENVLSGVKPYKIEFRIIRSDKTERNVLSQGEVLRDKDNDPLKMLGTLSDITDLHIVQNEIRKSNERFRAFMKNSTEAIFCIELERPVDISMSVDEQIAHLYKYAYVSEANDAWVRIAGFEHKKDLIGSRLENIISRTILENIVFLEEMIRSGYRLNDFETVDEYKSGVKIHASNSITGIIEYGYLVRIWGTGRDITEIKQMKEELMRSEKDLQKLAGWLISKQEKKCSQVARELHDDLTQQLAVIAIEAGYIEKHFRNLPEAVREKVLHIKERLIKVSKDAHNLSRSLHPSILYDLGLERAVESECSNFSSRTGISVVFEPRDVPLNIPKDISLAIYRIIQECLFNIKRHAKTKTAYVFLERSNSDVALTVKDTGVGFDTLEVGGRSALGLSSMRERVRLVNGKLSITSKPGKGTTIEVEIPLKGD
jgi:PAS domain S-box-containing protein